MSMLSLKNSVGKSITLTGKISKIMWQHIFGHFPSHPIENFFDLPDDSQLVVYSTEPLPEKFDLEITGKVIEIYGPPKRPEEKQESKVDDTYSEYHILLESYKVL